MKKLYTFSVKNITNKFIFQEVPSSNEKTIEDSCKEIALETSKERNDLSDEVKKTIDLEKQKWLTLAESDPIKVFEDINEDFLKKSWAKDLLVSVAKRAPWATFEHFNKYYKDDQPWMKKMLISASEKAPWAAFVYFDKYYKDDQLWMKKILINSAKKEPWDACAHFNTNETLLSKEILNIIKQKELLMMAAQNRPWQAFDYFNKYEDQNWAKEILAIATKVEPKLAFDDFDKYENQPWAIKILIIATKENPQLAFDNFDKYEKQPWMKKILIIATKKDPWCAFDYFKDPLAKNQLWAKEILTIARQKSSLIVAAKKNPQKAFEHLNMYKDLFWEKVFNEPTQIDILIEATKKCPWIAFEYFDKYIYHPLANTILTTAKQKNLLLVAAKNEPKKAFEYFHQYADQEWACDILMNVAQGAPQLCNDISFLENIISGLTKKEKQQLYYIKIGIESSGITMLKNGKHETIKFEEGLNKIQKEIKTSIKNYNLAKNIISKNIIPRHNTFWEDPALQQNISNVKFFSEKNENDKFRIIVARNLYFQDKEASEQNAKIEGERILKTRKLYENVPVFSERNIVFAAHLEKQKTDKVGDLNRFVKKALVKRIKKDGGKIAGVLRPQNTLKSLKETKQKILTSIINTPPPFTFIFSGHGSPNALYLSDGGIDGVTNKSEIKETEKTIKITVKDLFQSYKKRQEKYGKMNTPTTRDIFINGGCYNSNFMRNFYLLCDKEEVSKPIFLGESEYGQYGVTEYESKYNNNFYNQIFDNNKTKKAILGNIIKNDASNKNSNPSFYIPDDKNRTMQISSNDDMDSVAGERIA
jgi:hypothetical protein